MVFIQHEFNNFKLDHKLVFKTRFDPKNCELLVVYAFDVGKDKRRLGTNVLQLEPTCLQPPIFFHSWLECSVRLKTCLHAMQNVFVCICWTTKPTEVAVETPLVNFDFVKTIDSSSQLSKPIKFPFGCWILCDID